MCDFNKLTDDEKAHYHQQLMECVDAVGGKNFYLKILEEIRHTKPHPLTAKQCRFKTTEGAIISWNKVIFADKLQLLMQVRLSETENGNLLPDSKDKRYKKVLNLLRTLGPIAFTVKPKNLKDGEGFTLKPFTIVDDTTTQLNPLFDAFFFCSIDSIKKAMNYKGMPQESQTD